MTTEGSTPGAGLELPLALAVDAALEAFVPAVDPGEIKLWQFGDDQCLTTMLKLQRLEAAVAAGKLQLLGAMEERQITQHAAQLSTAVWLNGTTASSLPAAHREMGLAKGLHKRFPRIVAAMGRGVVSPEQASAIVGVLKKLPESLSNEQVQAAEKTMIGFAETYGPKGLRDLAQHLLEVIAPEIAEAAEGKRLDAQDRAARNNQYLRVRDDGDGTTAISGKLPAADGEALRTVIEAIANSAKAAEPDAAWAEGQPSYEARRAQALMTLVHSYQAGGERPRNGGDRPRVTVLVNWEDLLRGVRGATLLDAGVRISPAEARVLACDAEILPAIMGSNSQLLDLGRTTRLFAGDLRQAIVTRDRGCVFPGCPREPRDCDAHHLTPWTQGGTTSFDNAALVCPTHHRLVEPDPHANRATEHERWHMRMSRDGIPEVIPPSNNDEHRQPQRTRGSSRPSEGDGPVVRADGRRRWESTRCRRARTRLDRVAPDTLGDTWTRPRRIAACAVADCISGSGRAAAVTAVGYLPGQRHSPRSGSVQMRRRGFDPPIPMETCGTRGLVMCGASRCTVERSQEVVRRVSVRRIHVR